MEVLGDEHILLRAERMRTANDCRPDSPMGCVLGNAVMRRTVCSFVLCSSQQPRAAYHSSCCAQQLGMHRVLQRQLSAVRQRLSARRTRDGWRAIPSRSEWTLVIEFRPPPKGAWWSDYSREKKDFARPEDGHGMSISPYTVRGVHTQQIH